MNKRIVDHHPIICRSMATFPPTAALSFPFHPEMGGHDVRSTTSRVTVLHVLNILSDRWVAELVLRLYRVQQLARLQSRRPADSVAVYSLAFGDVRMGYGTYEE